MIRQAEFRRGSCRMLLNCPETIEDMTLANLRKIFAFMGGEAGNAGAFREFASFIPETEGYLRDGWDQESRYFQQHYESPDFDAKGNYISDPKERKLRRERNKRLEKNVLNAKKRYERFVKRIPKLKEMLEPYMA